MKLKIFSFNVRGLNAQTSIPMLKHYLDSVPAIDVLLIQETKLRAEACDKLKSGL
jgi:exonuclease III